MADNPFTHCKAVETHTGWHVSSDCWRVKAASEADARRTVEIINAAYGQINALLSPSMQDGAA